MSAFLITGTDTGVGKTHFALRWLKFNQETGREALVCKPVASGKENIDGRFCNSDVHLLAKAQGTPKESINLITFEKPLAPLCAARLEGTEIDRASLVQWCIQKDTPHTVFEGIGGLLVPLAEDYTVLDLASELNLPVILVARCGLGTINHTLLTVYTIRSAMTNIVSVLLSPETPEPDEASLSSIDFLTRHLSPIPVSTLPYCNYTDKLTLDESTVYGRIIERLEKLPLKSAH